MARPVKNALSIKIINKFNMSLKDYAQEKGLSYNSLKMFVSGVYDQNKIVKAQLVKDGILNGRPE